MSARGFTLIELLVSSAIVLLIAGAVAAVTPSARAAFERIPAELDVQQRGRTAIDVIAQQVRSALAVSGDAGTMIVATPVAGGGRGILATGQATSESAMPLSASGCPNAKDVCGFTAGMQALVSDRLTQDLFSIAAVSAGERSLTPDHPLSRPYEAGAAVTAVDQYTFRLERQSDGSLTLVRQTAAGAVQPIVDFVSDLAFDYAPTAVTVAIRVHPSSGLLVPTSEFHASISRRNVS